MLAIRSSCWAVLTLLMAGFIGHAADTTAAGGLQPLVAGNTAFALDLYGRLRTAEGNLFFSPYSISTCLAMTYAGARGDTATQMAGTLHFGADENQLAAAFGELQRQLNAVEQKKGIELNVANGLWAQKDHPFLPAFLAQARQAYQAKLAQVDFRTHAEPARMEINHWVSRQTKGRITDLIQPGVLDPATRLVLVNAIYFKGRWAREFDQHNTTNASFSVPASRKLQVPMMSLTAQFNYAEPEGLQLLQLPYAGGDLDMVVLLPRETDGLKRVEGLLNKQTLDRWLAQSRERQVAVFLPRFKLTAQFGLAQTLAQMGLQDALSPRANFSGMDGARDLFVSAVLHKAFVEVNEEGTEAAAATGTVMKMLAVRPLPAPVFRADHPFLFLIRDRRSGSLLFLGCVVDPTAA